MGFPTVAFVHKLNSFSTPGWAFTNLLGGLILIHFRLFCRQTVWAGLIQANDNSTRASDLLALDDETLSPESRLNISVFNITGSGQCLVVSAYGLDRVACSSDMPFICKRRKTQQKFSVTLIMCVVANVCVHTYVCYLLKNVVHVHLN